jgi:hypothetical protein
MKRDQDIQAEFSRMVAVDRLGEDEELREIEAGAAERAALAERFGLLKLDNLTASVRLKRIRGGGVRVKGSFSADVVQACVVTLAPVSSHLTDTFALVYAPDVEVPAGAEVVILPDEEETPEPLVGNAIDIGEAAAQCLALALDPYPRAPAARLAGRNGGKDEGPGPEAAQEKPFAALAVLRKKAKD